MRYIIRRVVAGLLVVLGVGVARAVEPPMNTLSDAEKAEGWTLLFDGTSLDQWTTSGAMWKAENGELLTSEPGKGWWLRTRKQYRDFELALDFNVPKGGNSGVGLRGSSNGDPAFTGMEIQIFDSFGTALADNVCGAVYNAITPAEQACKPAGEWNTYRIRLVGDTLDVWLNGKHVQQGQKLDERGYVHDPKNKSALMDRLTTGYISLQDHGDVVRFRNLKVHDLSPDKDPGGWVPLFSGKDTAGWVSRGKGEWKAEGGTLVGRNGPGHIFTEKGDFTDFEFRAMVRVNTKGNSGMYFRVNPKKDDPDTWPDGYEAQVDQHDPKNYTGVVYDRAYPKDVHAPITRDNAWFDYRVRAVGDHIQTWINGREMVDAELHDFASGHIALQSHHVGNQIEYRDIEWRDLSEKPVGQVKVHQRKPGEPVRVLFVTSSFGFKHPVLPHAMEVMAQAAVNNPWLKVTCSEKIDPIAGTNLLPTLAETDVLMLYTTGRLPFETKELAAWIEAGGALVGVHSATDTLSDDRAYVGLIGGVFDGHPWNEQVTVRIDDPASPLVASWNAKDGTFGIADEIYQFKALTGDLHVLMHLDAGQPKMEAGRSYPLAWTSTHGKGRVFYTALGHRPEVWDDPRYQGQVLAGIRWAAGLEPGGSAH